MRTLWLLVSALSLTCSSSRLPVARYLHGLNDSCPIKELEALFPSSEFNYSCIVIPYTLFGNLDRQVKLVCDQFDRDPDLREGFTLVGFSQGGLVARGVLQYCEVGKYVTNLLLYAAPNSGVSKLPWFSPRNPINWVVPYACLLPFMDSIFAPCGYSTAKLPRFLRKIADFFYVYRPTFLEKLNNEVDVDEESRTRIKNLENLMLFSYQEDTMVRPYCSPAFCLDSDQENQPVTLQNTRIYQLDLIGLKYLNERGRLFVCEKPGKHMLMYVNDIEKYMKPFIKVDGPQGSFWPYKATEGLDEYCTYNSEVTGDI